MTKRRTQKLNDVVNSFREQRKSIILEMRLQEENISSYFFVGVHCIITIVTAIVFFPIVLIGKIVVKKHNEKVRKDLEK